MVGRYNKAKRRRAKRDQKAIDGQLGRGTRGGDYVRPPRSECDEVPPITYRPTDTTALYIKSWVQKGKLSDFVMLHFTQLHPTDDGWYQLARIDCCHSVVHIHFDDVGMNKKSFRDIYELNIVNDVQKAWDSAYLELDNHWNERERRLQDAFACGDRRDRPTGRLPKDDFQWPVDEED